MKEYKIFRFKSVTGLYMDGHHFFIDIDLDSAMVEAIKFQNDNNIKNPLPAYKVKFNFKEFYQIDIKPGHIDMSV